MACAHAKLLLNVCISTSYLILLLDFKWNKCNLWSLQIDLFKCCLFSQWGSGRLVRWPVRVAGKPATYVPQSTGLHWFHFFIMFCSSLWRQSISCIACLLYVTCLTFIDNDYFAALLLQEESNGQSSNNIEVKMRLVFKPFSCKNTAARQWTGSRCKRG